jgi:arsenite oxidase small subunit
LDESPKDQQKVGEERRTFLKATVVASAALAVGGMAAMAKVLDETGGETSSATVSVSGFPKVLIADLNTGQVANTNTLQDNVPISFNYPLQDEPNILVKVGQPAENGVGPDGDIVAFSDICQHLGCNPGYVAEGKSPGANPSYVAPVPMFYCPCHGSKYNLVESAAIIQPSPTPRPVPQVVLDVDSNGNIYAVGMGPPVIYNSTGQHGPLGSTDVLDDLQGGLPVCTASTSVSS